MKPTSAAVLGVLALATGCVKEVRASSRVSLSARDSQVLVAGSEEDTARRLTEGFSQRGFTLADHQPLSGATVYTFKGPREVPHANGLVGSVFYVRLLARDGGTEVDLLGKPTLSGKPVCSDELVKWVPPCETAMAGLGWVGLSGMTGAEEAQTLRAILEALGGTPVAGAPGDSERATAGEKPAEAPTCLAEKRPEWKTASAREKKLLLEKCRAPGPATP